MKFSYFTEITLFLKLPVLEAMITFGSGGHEVADGNDSIIMVMKMIILVILIVMMMLMMLMVVVLQ